MTTIIAPAELLAVTEKEKLNTEISRSIIDQFAPFLDQINEWKEKALALVVTDETQTAEMQLAREGRLALRKVRTTADNLREQLKADSLRYGRAVQGIYNVIESGIVPIEKHLEDQEKFVERMEEKRRNELRIERQQKIAGLHEYFPVNIDLGYMTPEDFDLMYNGAILQQKAAEQAKADAEEAARVAAEKAAEERIAKEKADEEERERLRIENERLQKERDRLEMEQRKANIEAAKARKEAEAKAAEERAERERLEAELKAKREAEEKAEADRIAAQEAELAKGDAEKFNDLLSRLQSIKTDFAFKSKKHKTIHASVGELIDKTITYAKSKL